MYGVGRLAVLAVRQVVTGRATLQPTCTFLALVQVGKGLSCLCVKNMSTPGKDVNTL